MHREVHLVQVDSGVVLLHAEDADLAGGGLLVALHELGGVDEHAARAAGRVEDAAMVRLDDLHDELDDGLGGVENATLLALALGELAQEVLVHLAEGVTRKVDGGPGA